jgi:O-antigen ligase
MRTDYLDRSNTSRRHGFLDSALASIQANIPAIMLGTILVLSLIGPSPVALFPPTTPIDPSTGDGDTLRQACFVMVFLVMAWHVGVTRGLEQLLHIPMSFVVVLSWCWLSLLWAVDPEVSMRRIGLTTLVIVTVTHAVRGMTPKTVMTVLVWTFVAILVADWISIALLQYAVQQPDEIEKELAGDWRGLHLHKNEAGAFCAIALIVFINAAYRARSRLLGLFMIAAAAGFLFFTHSKTSGGFVFVAMLIGLLAHRGYNNPTLRDVSLALALCAVITVISLDLIPYDLIDAEMNDPAAFTGRVQIWPVLMQFANDHFLLGSGYGSFWAIGPDSPIFAYTSNWVTTIFEAHNGYLELQVQTGFIGLALVVCLLVIRPLHILFFGSLRGGVSRWLICSILVFGFLHDLFESSLLDRSKPTWVVMVVMYVLLEDARLHPRARITLPYRLDRGTA